ncbi:hypothetical protein D3C71_2168440 [compost metagenome]
MQAKLDRVAFFGHLGEPDPDVFIVRLSHLQILKPLARSFVQRFVVLAQEFEVGLKAGFEITEQLWLS